MLFENDDNVKSILVHNDSKSKQKKKNSNDNEDIIHNTDNEMVVKHISTTDDKIFINASIKINVGDYSSASIDFGISHSIAEEENIDIVADNLFKEFVYPKAKKFAIQLMQLTKNIVKAKDNTELLKQIVTSQQNNTDNNIDKTTDLLKIKQQAFENKQQVQH